MGFSSSLWTSRSRSEAPIVSISIRSPSPSRLMTKSSCLPLESWLRLMFGLHVFYTHSVATQLYSQTCDWQTGHGAPGVQTCCFPAGMIQQPNQSVNVTAWILPFPYWTVSGIISCILSRLFYMIITRWNQFTHMFIDISAIDCQSNNSITS